MKRKTTKITHNVWYSSRKRHAQAYFFFYYLFNQSMPATPISGSSVKTIRDANYGFL